MNYCDYGSCKNTEETHELITVECAGDEFVVCSECLSKFEDGNQSGYCSQSCQMGHGCDDSC